MTLSSSLLYAFRLFFTKRKNEKSLGRKTLSGAMICIAISLIPLVCVKSVSDAMVNAMTERLIGLSSLDIRIQLESGNEDCKSEKNMLLVKDRALTVPGLKYGFAEVQGTGLAAGKNYRTGACIRGIEKNLFETSPEFSKLLEVKEGKASFSNARSAVLCQKIANDLNLHAGDTFTLLTLKKSPSGKNLPQFSVFKVEGIVSSGYQELDALWVFIPMDSAIKILDSSSALNFICLKADDSFSVKMKETASNVRNELSSFSDEKKEIGPFHLATWDVLYASKMDNFASTKLMILLVIVIVVLVASVNISSAIIMLVMERKKEIAILKSLGASSGGIAFSFMTASFLCSLGGCIIGIPLGIAAALNANRLIAFAQAVVNFFARIFSAGKEFVEIELLSPSFYIQNVHVTIEFSTVLIVFIATLLLSLLVSFIPSIKAGREKPIETLRKM